jgi:hypothetical protein
MDLSLGGSAIGYADFDQQVCRRGLGVFDEYVEISVFIENPGVERFVFRIAAAATSVRIYQIRVRNSFCGYL